MTELALPPQPSALAILARNRHALAGAVIMALLIAIALLGPVIAPFDPLRTGVGPVMAPPGALFLMGTDDLGRDILSRICLALGTSIEIGLTAAAISTLAGIAIGAPTAPMDPGGPAIPVPAMAGR